MTDAITRAMLEELARLRSLVEESFYEGYNYGMWDKYNDGDSASPWTILKANLSWEESESKKELEE